MPKELLFSVTKKDFVVQTFRAGGKGGQNQNKVETGVRIIHPASGAVGECREERSQLQNKKRAFLRLVGSKKFQDWHKMQTARILGELDDIERQVEKMLAPKNLRVEKRVNGKWVPWRSEEVGTNEEEKTF